MKIIIAFSLVIFCQITSTSAIGQIQQVDLDVYADEHVFDNLFGIFGVDESFSEQQTSHFPPQHMLNLYEIYSGISSSDQNFKYRDANVVRSFSCKGRLV